MAVSPWSVISLRIRFGRSKSCANCAVTETSSATTRNTLPVTFSVCSAASFSANEIVWRRPDKSIQRSTYAEFHKRAQKLANALTRLGVKPGDRVATLAWNHGRHLEAYFAIPLCGAVLHMLNPRLSVQDIAYIINHAEDSVVIVDDVLWSVWERIRPEVKPRDVIVWAPDQP